LPGEIERGAELLRAVGADVPPEGLRPRVYLTQEDREEAERLLGEIQDDQCLVCIMPGCRDPIRAWPAERYVAVAKALLGRYPQKARFVVCGGSQDRPIAETITRDVGPAALNLAGCTTIRVLAAVLERCGLYIGAETGAAHMALAMNTATVVILGGGHFGRFFPHPGPHRVVHKWLSCYHCDWDCSREQPECILSIMENEVTAATVALIEECAIIEL